jgi:UDP-N-acetylmuramyl pentapeptide phosphotransferase/UDP-N-acetylglucosamine-1-phosphate transferase/glycosyltransferase involved in cell wall biosynthesis
VRGDQTAVLAAVACGVFVTLAEPATIRLLRRAAAIDVPGPRSSHTVPTPRGGGAPIAVALVAAALLVHSTAALTLCAAVAAFAGIGLADDLAGLPPGRRLALQSLAAAGVAGVLAAEGSTPLAVTAVTAAVVAVWLASFVNAFNFMDGVNGISAAHAVVGGVAYACLGWWRADPLLAVAGSAVAAGALAFLPWNAVRARVFLGDVGSYGLGAALAVLAAHSVLSDRVPPEAALAPLALYLADTGWTLQRRIRAREPLFQAHRTHVYQRLCDAGWSHQRVTVATAAVTVMVTVLGAASLSGRPLLRAAADLAAVALLAAYLRSPVFAVRLRAAEPGPVAREQHHILIVTQYFPPEAGAPQARLSALAAAWAAGGDAVTVLTGMPNHPTGILPPEYRRAIRRIERRDGYRVVRTWLYATPNQGVSRKTVSHLSFMVSSVLLGGLACGRADTVVVSSPAFFSIGSAWLMARLMRARLVVEVRDLWPAIFTELGVMTSRPLIRALERLELAAYAAADQVVVVSEGFRDNLIGRGVPAGQVHTIRNGVDLAGFRPDMPADPVTRARLGARPGDCLVLYAGTHGISQALPGVADAAKVLADRPVHVAFVGEGSDKPRLRCRVAELGLTNVTLAGPVPPQQVPRLLAAADICLVTLRDVPLFATFIPSKMFEYLASGRPVIGAVAGEAAQLLREAGAVVVPPENHLALAVAIRALAADPARRAAMGRRGRAYVERHFDRAELAARYRKLLDAPGPVPGELRPQVPSPRPPSPPELPSRELSGDGGGR